MAAIRYTITGSQSWNSNALTVSVSASGNAIVFIHDDVDRHDSGSSVLTRRPVFDANGWCHDMDTAPTDGTPFLVAWTVLKDNLWLIQTARWSFDHDCFVIDWDHDDEVGPFHAWRPLPAPPMKDRDQ